MNEFDRLVKKLPPSQLDGWATALLIVLEGKNARRGAADTLAGAVMELGATPDDAGEDRPRAASEIAAMTAAERIAAAIETLAGGKERNTEESPSPGAAAGARGAESADAASAAAISGQNEKAAAPPSAHRRYENAVGSRGLEMSRVSDYFRRDSRRYDTGYERY